MKKKTIVYLVSSLANEGPVNVMYNIIKYLDNFEFDVYIMTLSPEKENSRRLDFKNLGVRIIQLSPNKPLGIFTLARIFKHEIKLLNPSLIHSHCARSLVIMSIFKPKDCRTVYTAHIYPGLQQKVLHGKLIGGILIKMSNFFMMKADLPIACSDSVSQQFQEINGWTVRAINNGTFMDTDIEDFNKSQLRRKLGLCEHRKYFIFVGRLSAEKNPLFLAQTFKKVKKTSIGLLILGSGPLHDSLKDFEDENIKIVGFQRNILDYLQVSDYYISASDVEGLANTLLESMCVGLPMVLSKIPSHELIIQNSCQEIGVLYDQKKTESLLEAIDKIQKLPIDVSENIRRYYQKNFTAEIMSKKYQEAYLSLL